MDIKTDYRKGIEYVAINKEINFIRGFCRSASNDKNSVLDSLRERMKQIEGNIPKTLVGKLTFLGGVVTGGLRPLKETRRFIQVSPKDQYQIFVRPQVAEQKRPDPNYMFN